MKDAELNVIRLGANDIITTSGAGMFSISGTLDGVLHNAVISFNGKTYGSSDPNLAADYNAFFGMYGVSFDAKTQYNGNKRSLSNILARDAGTYTNYGGDYAAGKKISEVWNGTWAWDSATSQFIKQ